MPALTVLQAGPAMTVQDAGRPGYRALGLTVGGAADPVALAEGTALLGQKTLGAAIEMAGMGGTFRADADLRIALTGGAMTAKIDGEPVRWHASHALLAGATLTIGGAVEGSYGYLHVGGGIDTPKVMGARGAHLACGIGGLIVPGDVLALGDDPGGLVDQRITPLDRFSGGAVRVVASMQTESFAGEVLARFTETTFRRDARANRMGVRLEHDGQGYATDAALSIVSEVVVPGDIQISGDGAPYVLMSECQTTGGYPRIASVLPCDLPRVAQAMAGAPLRFGFVDLAAALEAEARHAAALAALPRAVSPLIRDPAAIRDLLSYQLISGVTSGAA